MSTKAIVYQRDHINTDEIIPARYLTSDKEADLALHAMEDLDMDFLRKVNQGDVVVAGTDFGCGSSREHAVWALRGAGVKAVIADSFARIFYRNCLNNGFVAIECPGATGKINNEDELELDFDKGVIVNKTQKTEIKFNPFPPFAKSMLDAGGLLNYIQKNN